jgi:integration host factor subunit alpha
VSGKTITRADLIEAIHQRIGLSRIKCGELLELVLKEITDCLERGETVKLSSFGSFVVRKKGQRIGRNPKTGREVPISARRVMMFKPSNTLKLRINFGPEWRQRRGQVTGGSPSPGELRSSPPRWAMAPALQRATPFQ